MKRNVLLSKYTTFKIGGPAEYFFEVKDKKELISAVKFAKEKRLPFFILGGGSNLLVSDKGFRGVVINFQFSIFNFQSISNSKIFKITAGAGLPLNRLVNISTGKGFSGLEWAVGIPGTIGGAVFGNAGAFGKSMKDIIETVEALDIRKDKFINFKNKECRFGYRNSIFKKNKNLVIVSVELKLKKGNKKNIKKRIKENLIYKKEKQPLNYPSAGSVFKNPRLRQGYGGQSKSFTAARLIEECGLKGKQVGNAKISDKHANFIVNLGKAKAKDVKKLINFAKQRVKKNFKINLEEEIQFL